MTDKQIIIDAFNSAWNRKVATESSYGKLASKEVFENNNEDKQIIIDGVDVSGCEFFSSGLGYCTIGLLADDGTHICECEQDCYYKQLKRKEQECEKLKKIINEAKNSKLDLKSFLVGEAVQNEYEQQLDQLKAENERLKNAVMLKCPQCGEVYLNPIGCELHEENQQLKQTLTEIKEIVTNFYETVFLRTENGCILINNNTCVETLDKILQKISEVENDKNS